MTKCVTMEACASYGAMVLVQLAYGGSNILMKIALERGLNQLVFVVYRHIIAMLLLGPFAYVLERVATLIIWLTGSRELMNTFNGHFLYLQSRKRRPSLSLSVMTKIFLLSSLGTTIHLNVYYAGLAYTSPTVASALSNVIPSLTFLIAVILKMEKVKITGARGQAKVLGTLICVGGALTFTFWKGRYLLPSFVHKPLINVYSSSNGSVYELRHGKDNWMKGSVLILISHVAWSGWLILQAVVYKVYPARLSLTTLICFFATLQSSVLALFFARNPTLWKLEWNMQLLTIIYCGVVISALVYYLQTWCISNRGPVFAAMFSPLLLIIVGLFSAIAFAERQHLGSLIGAFIVIVGLYCVLWGKRTDNLVSGQPENGKDLDDNEILEISINDSPVVNPVRNETK